jgi:hypothetical protein
MTVANNNVAGLTAERLRSLLDYNPLTGLFTRLVRTANCTKVGEVVGTVDAQGYIGIKIYGRRYKAHRLAWLYQTGKWPEDQVDHENLNRSDNKWSNLREATRSQNMHNTPVQKNNKLGLKGVRSEKGGKFTARITINRMTRSLGTFTTVELAAAAYAKAANENFKEFARVAA